MKTFTGASDAGPYPLNAIFSDPIPVTMRALRAGKASPSRLKIVDMPELVSIKRLAAHFDAHRASVRRWLDEAGIQPVALGNGRKGAIRYRMSEVKGWIESRPNVR